MGTYRVLINFLVSYNLAHDPSGASNPFGIGGLSAAYEDYPLFIVVCYFALITFVLWVNIVWVNTDPGLVDTRGKNFDEVI